jgi:hypothetical protein
MGFSRSRAPDREFHKLTMFSPGRSSVLPSQLFFKINISSIQYFKSALSFLLSNIIIFLKVRKKYPTHNIYSGVKI